MGMALKFNCSNCNADVYTKFLKIGEEYKCKNCLNVRNVPEDAQSIKESEIPNPENFPDKKQNQKQGKEQVNGTTSAGSIADASELAGAATDPRMSISGIEWSVAATTQILWDATSNVVCFTCNGSGSYGFGDGAPALANNGGSGVTGDVLCTHGTSVGTIVVRFRKVSGWDNIT